MAKNNSTHLDGQTKYLRGKIDALDGFRKLKELEFFGY